MQHRRRPGRTQRLGQHKVDSAAVAVLAATGAPSASLAIVRGGRIALIGSTADVKAQAGRARVFDANLIHAIFVAV